MAVDMTEQSVAVEAFAEKVFIEFTGTIAIAMAAIGDRLGLFKRLATDGPMTSQELAGTARIDGRYALEWLKGMTCAGYLEHDVISDRYVLPIAHIPVLADEGGPAFMGGPLQQIPAVIGAFDHVVASFRNGGGVHQAEYHRDMWEGMQRETAGTFNNLLVQAWIPAIPDVQHKLERGALVADIGCGSGLALIRLAEAFPNTRFVGYDNFPGQIERATANAVAAGVTERVRFELLDAVDGLPDRYDVVTSFDVIHDAVHPGDLIGAIRAGLKSDGVYVMVEPAAGESLEDNSGPIGTFLYGASIFYCMTTSLAEGGEGLGTAGLPESKVRSVAAEAGFSIVTIAPSQHPLYALYDLRP